VCERACTSARAGASMCWLREEGVGAGATWWAVNLGCGCVRNSVCDCHTKATVRC